MNVQNKNLDDLINYTRWSCPKNENPPFLQVSQSQLHGTVSPSHSRTSCTARVLKIKSTAATPISRDLYEPGKLLEPRSGAIKVNDCTTSTQLFLPDQDNALSLTLSTLDDEVCSPLKHSVSFPVQSSQPKKKTVKKTKLVKNAQKLVNNGLEAKTSKTKTKLETKTEATKCSYAVIHESNVRLGFPLIVDAFPTAEDAANLYANQFLKQKPPLAPKGGRKSVQSKRVKKRTPRKIKSAPGKRKKEENDKGSGSKLKEKNLKVIYETDSDQTKAAAKSEEPESLEDFFSLLCKIEIGDEKEGFVSDEKVSSGVEGGLFKRNNAKSLVSKFLLANDDHFEIEDQSQKDEIEEIFLHSSISTKVSSTKSDDQVTTKKHEAKVFSLRRSLSLPDLVEEAWTVNSGKNSLSSSQADLKNIQSSNKHFVSSFGSCNHNESSNEEDSSVIDDDSSTTSSSSDENTFTEALMSEGDLTSPKFDITALLPGFSEYPKFSSSSPSSNSSRLDCMAGK